MRTPVLAALVVVSVLAMPGAQAAACPPFTDPRGDIATAPVGIADVIDVVGADFRADGKHVTAVIRVAGMTYRDVPAEVQHTFAFRVGSRYVGLRSYRGPLVASEYTVVEGASPDDMDPVASASGVFDTSRATIRMTAPMPAMPGVRGGARLDRFTVTTLYEGAVDKDTATWTGVVVLGKGCTAAG